MRSYIAFLQEQLLGILESEEKARNQEGHQPAPASADGSGSSMPAMGDLARLAAE